MATIQARVSRGKKYWYIVQSVRVNGKPRPITLAYLGTTERLLERLQEGDGAFKFKSYSHGAVAALLKIADELNVCQTINQFVCSPRKNTSKKPIRNGLTVGATLLFAAIGRACNPTSKAGWAEWAEGTSLHYLLKKSDLEKLDSQHFWDAMDALPIDAIAKIESALLRKISEETQISGETLFFDTTNVFTYIHSTNERNTLAKRGKNKQKRNDLRQVGLAMVTMKPDPIPLFHMTYEGNRHDSKIFTQIIGELSQRLKELHLSGKQHTIVFDRGNNSKQNLALIKEHGFHYVGALVPYQHKAVIYDAIKHFEKSPETLYYRDKRDLMGDDRTVVVFISERLKASQLNWLYRSLDKTIENLKRLQADLLRKRYPENIVEEKINRALNGNESLINYSMELMEAGKTHLSFSINQDQLAEREKAFGLRIMMTDHHDWSNEDIIQTYHGQSHIEQAFRHLKNPHCLSIRPQFHWTDQKIRVHFFTCVLGYLLSSLIWLRMKNEGLYKEDLDSFIRMLNHVRLGVLVKKSKQRGHPKPTIQLEEMSRKEQRIIEALSLQEYHIKRPQIKGVVLYK